MLKIHFMFFDAGGGHRSAATALREEIAAAGKPWACELVQVQELLDELDIFRKVTGLRLEDCYNLLLKKGWTLGSPQMTRLMQMVIRWFHRDQVRLLTNFWRNHRPDLVVSLVPNLNRAMYEALAASHPGVPYVTILTDLADYPPHFWIERQRQYFICGTDKAMEQVAQYGHPEARAFRVSGMILNPRFRARPQADRAAERRKLGLDPEAPTGLVMFGGQGSRVMELIAREVETQLICICGKNDRLAESLRRMRRNHPMFVEGFTHEVPYYMSLADYFIGKPGPGSVSEALAMRLPVIVERNVWTLPQERYNTDWVRENGYGLVLPHFRGIGHAVRELLEPERYARVRQAVSTYENRAVHEIPDILEQILRRQA
jgi:1,2-diacylglycerol 3-beta-galactosyltransferase